MNVREAHWGQLLTDATERVQLSVSAIALGGDRALVVGTGASGDKTLLADRVAEEELIRAVSKVEGVMILSEEAGRRGDPKAGVLAIIDPLDGSSNFESAIPFYCTSVAIVEGDKLGGASFGLLRNLVTGDVYAARKGAGATKNGKSIRTSRTKEPSESVVGIDLSSAEPSLVKDLAPLIVGVRRQVHFGANALELCFLAEGRIDAFVDLRKKMRITDFAAAYLIAKEAGASITKADGAALRPGLDLTKRFSYVASANSELHKRILELASGAAHRRR